MNNSGSPAFLLEKKYPDIKNFIYLFHGLYISPDNLYELIKGSKVIGDEKLVTLDDTEFIGHDFDRFFPIRSNDGIKKFVKEISFRSEERRYRIAIELFGVGEDLLYCTTLEREDKRVLVSLHSNRQGMKGTYLLLRDGLGEGVIGKLRSSH